MEFEERFGVKVDVKLPEEDKVKLYEQWESWVSGKNSEYTCIIKQSLMTRYEHFALGSGVGLPPDPFKPLASQHKGANLEAVINARREEFPPGKECRGPIYAHLVPNVRSLLGLKPTELFLAGEEPDIDHYGRVRIPRIIGAYDRNGRKLELSQDIIDRLQLPTSRDDLKLWSGSTVREVFDFDNGYRIELVSLPK